MIRTVASLIQAAALLLVLTGSAIAKTALPAAADVPAPVLRANVTVTSDIVRIGDLVENAGPAAEIPIFRSPDLGTTGAVAAERVIEAVRPYQVVDVDTRGVTDVIVTRASRVIGTEEISARIAEALSAQFGLGDTRNISVSFDRPIRALQVEPNATGKLQVAALHYDPRGGHFEVTLDLPSSLLLQQRPPRLAGTAVVTVEAVSVDRPVERGEVLQTSDLTVLRRPRTEGGAIADIGAAVGLAARHALRPGQPLAAADLMKPDIVQRNDTVTLIYEAPGITLTVRGQAQDAGGLGDTVGVLNVQTKHAVQGVITGPDRVSVSPTAARLVDNAADPARGAVAVLPERQQ